MLGTHGSAAGAAGFAKVLSNLKAYAAEKGYGRVFFGPQAASGFELANGTEIADWVYGAQHVRNRPVACNPDVDLVTRAVCFVQLYASGQWLLQPLGVKGTEPATGPQWCGLSRGSYCSSFCH